MSIQLKRIRVNGELREVQVRTLPFPHGTAVFLDGEWWPIACHPCDVTEVGTRVIGKYRGLEFEMPHPRPGDFPPPVPLIYDKKPRR
jgi:hypothetical protein